MPPDAVLSVREREKQAARHPVTRLGLRCCGAASTRASAWAASVRPANVAEAVLRIRRVGRASRSTRARKDSVREARRLTETVQHSLPSRSCPPPRVTNVSRPGRRPHTRTRPAVLPPLLRTRSLLVPVRRTELTEPIASLDDSAQRQLDAALRFALGLEDDGA
jgi:hypothetical protein